MYLALFTISYSSGTLTFYSVELASSFAVCLGISMRQKCVFADLSIFFICLYVRDGCDGDGQLLSQLEVILFSENQGREQSASAHTTPVKFLL